MSAAIYILLLFQCIALSAGGVLLGLRLRKRLRENYLTHCLFMLALLAVYGMYSIWGRGGLVYLLSLQPGELLDRMNLFFSLMGTPFVAGGWLMLAWFAEAIRGKKDNPWLQSMLIIISASALALSRMFPRPLPAEWYIRDTGHIALTLINLAWFFYAGITLILIDQRKTPWRDARPAFWPGFALLASGLLQSGALLIPGKTLWLDFLLILMYFAGISLPLAVLYRSPLIRRPPKEESSSFIAFCKKYELTPREAEVVKEICTGKSNKEIAECLFISLQTVKDHTHNIFIKTEVKNRLQLANKADQGLRAANP